MTDLDLLVDTNGFGVNLLYLPDWTSFQYTDVGSDVGSGTLEYPTSGLHSSSLVAGAQVVIRMDNQIVGRFIYEDDDLDKAAEEQANKPKQIQGRTTHGLLDRAIWYPPIWPAFTGTTDNIFAGVTPGAIIKNFMNRAQSRGALPNITHASFSSTTDSNGKPWSQILTITFDAATNLLDTLTSLRDGGFLEFKMVGYDLRIYNPGGITVDRTVQAKPVILTRGRDLTEAPEKNATREVKTALLMKGDNNELVELNDSTAAAQFERRETMLSQQGVADRPTLQIMGNAQLGLLNRAKVEKTAGGILSSDTPRPWIDYGLEDWVWYDVGGTKERLKVKQLVLSGDNQGKITWSATLNDKITDFLVRLQRRTAGILGGVQPISDNVGPTSGDESKFPAAPSAVLLSTSAYVLHDGQSRAQIAISWPAVTTNDDGTAADDIQGYEVQYQFTNDPQWHPVGQTSDTVAYVSDLPIRRSVRARVRTIDTGNRRSLFTLSLPILTAFDTTPPPKPSAPLLSSYAPGGFRIFWDGKGALGEDMPDDFDHLEIHASVVNNFTPVPRGPNSGGTQIDSVQNGLWLYYANNDYGTTYYFKFVAVDHSGNRSLESAQVSGLPSQAKDGDLESLNVGKLTAGNLTADITVSARIKTANTGARAELAAVGIQLFNSSNVRTTFFDASTGDAQIFGAITTDIDSGGRLINIDLNQAGKPGVALVPPTGLGFVTSGGLTFGSTDDAVQVESPATNTTPGTKLYLNDDVAELDNNPASGSVSSMLQLFRPGGSIKGAVGGMAVRVPIVNGSEGFRAGFISYSGGPFVSVGIVFGTTMINAPVVSANLAVAGAPTTQSIGNQSTTGFTFYGGSLAANGSIHFHASSTVS
jgi:hypothetical protein